MKEIFEIVADLCIAVAFSLVMLAILLATMHRKRFADWWHLLYCECPSWIAYPTVVAFEAYDRLGVLVKRIRQHGRSEWYA